MKKKENIILCDCRADEVMTLCSSIINETQKELSIRSHISNWKRTGKISELKRYLKYFSVAFKYFSTRKRYDVIIGWQQFYAIIFGFFCSVFHTKKINTVVALNFTYKAKNGKFGKMYKWFMKRSLESGYVDYLHVPSKSYAEEISNSFNFSLDRIIVIPFGINDPYEKFSKLKAPIENRYVLAIGRSNRDYDFLISAWKNIDYPLVIISDTYEGDNGGNSTVSIIKNVAGSESYPWVANCAAMVIPIDDGSICSGDTVLLTAMAMKKKIVVTVPSTLSEMYIVDGENGLLCQKDENAFGSLMNKVLFSSEYDCLQSNARSCYLNNYSRESMGKRVAEFLIRHSVVDAK